MKKYRGKKKPYHNKDKRKNNDRNGKLWCQKNTKELIEKLGQSIAKAEDFNFYLRLNKFPVYDRYDKKFLLKETINEVLGKNNFFQSAIKAYSKEFRYMIKRLESTGFVIGEKKFKPDYKLIVGLGGANVYENSMTLHHIYGFPYIPGQAIKGVLRHYIISEILGFDDNSENDESSGNNKDSEDKDLEDETFKFIFGTQEGKGKVIFFDAIPVSDAKIDIDIMNNHYPDYYGDKAGSKPPADYYNPIPINFLVVKDTEFLFTLGLKPDVQVNNLRKFTGGEISSKGELLNYLFELLKESLSLLGIGAKTSVGYGFMSEA